MQKHRKKTWGHHGVLILFALVLATQAKQMHTHSAAMPGVSLRPYSAASSTSLVPPLVKIFLATVTKHQSQTFPYDLAIFCHCLRKREGTSWAALSWPFKPGHTAAQEHMAMPSVLDGAGWVLGVFHCRFWAMSPEDEEQVLAGSSQDH